MAVVGDLEVVAIKLQSEEIIDWSRIKQGQNKATENLLSRIITADSQWLNQRPPILYQHCRSLSSPKGRWKPDDMTMKKMFGIRWI